VEDLLDVSRIVSGKVDLDIRPVHPVTLIDAVVDSMRPAASAKAITLETSLDLRGGPIAADAGRMQQVLWNLLSNSIKFTGREGRVDVRLARAEPNVEVVVSDTGEGITAEVLPYVFDRFRQGDASTTRRHGGLGLGLALVKHLVEAHGGTVTAHSDGPGRGATFTVRLPLLGQNDPAVVRRVRGEARALFGPRLDGCRVLAVDDDADALDLIARVLDRAGATVHTAASVPRAMAVIGETPLDVVLADLQMPGEDGFALIERLRATSAPSARMPAVAVTAYGSIEDRVRVLAAGFDAHLAKPVDSDELVAVIRRLLARAERS
jgi:CheY-like chemotaxis protein